MAQNLAALNAPSAYQQAKLKQLIQLDLGTLPEDELSALLAGVDEMKQEASGGREPAVPGVAP